MSDPWTLEVRGASGAPDGFEGMVSVAPESGYFRGHFPGDPILPGIAALMCLVVGPARERWRDLGCASGLSKVKFRSPVRPGDELRIALLRQGAAAVKFSLLRGHREVACGVVLFGQKAPR